MFHPCYTLLILVIPGLLLLKKRKNQTSQGYQIVLETQDHKPNLTREYQRIVQAGGRVTKEEDDDYRVNDVLFSCPEQWETTN